MDYLKHFYINMMTLVKRMTGSQMVLAVALIAGVILTAFLLFGVFQKVNYVTLYSDLDASSASEIVDKLEEMNVRSKISDGGKTVSVPSGDVYKARMKLAALGLPKSGTVGYAIFDKTNLGMTEFLQKVNFRRAIEGELARSVMELSPVEAARVHIVIPEDHLFEEDQKRPTASVLVKLSAGGTLSARQIRGVTHLIASAVEGLTPEDIAIIDYEGNLLTQNTGSDPLAAMSGTQLELRKSVEKYLESKAQSLLDNSVGQGKSIVRVTAALNFNQVETTSEQYDPDNLAIRSEERTTEAKRDATSSVPDSTSTNNTNSVETAITNYEVNKTAQHVVNSVGTIEKLTVAVLVDGVYEPKAGEGGDETLEYKPRDAEELNRIAALVRNAVGFDSKRDDQIEVVNMRFDNGDISEEQKQLDTIATRSYYFDMGKKVLMVIAGIFVFFYAKRKIKKAFVAVGKYIPPLPPPPPPPAVQEPPIVIQPQRSRLVDQMRKTAEDRPDEIARVIRTIMTE
jgi:flagellar M-ring protein FliF